MLISRKLIKCHQSLINTCSVHQILQQETDLSQMKRTCSSWCRSYQDDLFKVSKLDGYILPDCKASIELAPDFETLSNYVFDGYQVGKIALIDFRSTLAYSKELSSSRDLELLKDMIGGLIALIKALKQMSSVVATGEHIFLNNWSYPVHLIVLRWAMKHELDVINFNATGMSLAHLNEHYFMSRLGSSQWLRQLSGVVENKLDELKFSVKEISKYSLYNYRNQSGYSCYSYSTRSQPKLKIFTLTLTFQTMDQK